MRILWLCNIMLPVIAKQLHLPVSNKEGWLSGLADKMLEREGNQIELGICFPTNKAMGNIQGAVKGIAYYGFLENVSKESQYEEKLEDEMKAILQDFKPDMVHIFGTEFAHSLAMVKAFQNPERTLVGIQGVCTLCAESYMAYLPLRIQNRFLLRDFLKQDNIRQQQKKFKMRGDREREVIRKVMHVTGRTEFDKKFCREVNQNAVYHFMNETLRSEFYREKWEMRECERNSIFVSQANYPLKGFHMLLEALPKVKEKYPHIKVYVAGDNITKYQTIKEKLKISSYGKYLLERIRKNHLQENICFMGMVTSEQMCTRMKKSHIFVLTSSIENSPNSLGEAMLLGLPIVSARVGGVTSMITENEEGLLYPADSAEELAKSICRLLEDDKLAAEFSQKARRRALQTHDAETNYQQLMNLYQTIVADK